MSIQSVLDENHNAVSQRVALELLATRKQAVNYLDDLDPSISATQRIDLLVEQFAYTRDEARQLYNEWLEDVD